MPNRISSAPQHSSLAVAFSLFMLSGCSLASGPTPVAFSVHVESVSVDPRSASPVVLLREDAGEHRRLPIWIGAFEAQSIAIAMENVSTPRPNTHDLIKSVLESMRAKIERIVITELRESTYYAVIEFVVDGRRVSLDSRPSDAIAVAIRTGAPLFATEQVFAGSNGDAEEEEALDISFPRAKQPADRIVH